MTSVLLDEYMSGIKFEVEGKASDEALSILSYLNTNHPVAMGKISTAVHVSDAQVELGACLSSSENFVTGTAKSVDIPVCGTESHPSVYVHTQPMMKWKPSQKDILQSTERGELTRGFVTLTTNGLDSVFGSITALPNSIISELNESGLSGMKLKSKLRDEGHLVKITSQDPPSESKEDIQSAVDSGLLDKEYLQ